MSVHDTNYTYYELLFKTFVIMMAHSEIEIETHGEQE
jgi:hypothetical protein